MATFQSKRAVANAIGRYKEAGVFSDTATYVFSGEAAGAVVNMIKVAGADAPGGITVIGWELTTAALGTLTANLGDTGNASRLLTGVNVGAGGTFRSAGAFPYTYTTDTTIDLTTITGAATGQATLTVYMVAGAEQLS